MPRWFHKLYAHLNGYFWLPCIICGRMRGGHEQHGTETVLKTCLPDFELGTMVCSDPACSEEALRRNLERFPHAERWQRTPYISLLR